MHWPTFAKTFSAITAVFVGMYVLIWAGEYIQSVWGQRGSWELSLFLAAIIAVGLASMIGLLEEGRRK